VTNSTHKLFPSGLHTVFVDRDGVVNRKLPEGRYVTTWKEFQILPHVVESIARLNGAGLRVVLVSNQRGIALGLYTEADVRAIHKAFEALLTAAGAHVDGFYYCPHDHNQCNCRKPLPGLFEQATADLPAIAADSSVMIGDSISDIEFGRNLGMKTIFVDADPAHQKPGVELARQLADISVSSLAEAVEALLAPSSSR